MSKHLLVTDKQHDHDKSPKSVWDLIHPSIPDTLCEIEQGFYEARWWKPVPLMDIEILKVTEGIFIEGNPFEPDNLPSGIAIRFRLCET